MQLKKILGSIRKVDETYNLIEPNDKIAVGVSGGKDSVLLLYCLNLYRKFADKPFDVMGIAIDLGFKNDLTPIVEFFKQLDIEFIIEPTHIGKILNLNLNKGRIDCSLCSNLKKGALIKVAKDHHCTKIALGHNADDAIETLLLNGIYGGKLAVFDPKQYLSRDNVSFIRPLIYAYENDILATCIKQQLPIVSSNCPKDGHSKRQEMKEMLNALYIKYPQAKSNFLLMLHNDVQTSLWHPK